MILKNIGQYHLKSNVAYSRRAINQGESTYIKGYRPFFVVAIVIIVHSCNCTPLLSEKPAAANWFNLLGFFATSISRRMVKEWRRYSNFWIPLKKYRQVRETLFHFFRTLSLSSWEHAHVTHTLFEKDISGLYHWRWLVDNWVVLISRNYRCKILQRECAHIFIYVIIIFLNFI